MQAVCELLGGDYNRNCCKGFGMFGKCKVFLQHDEEQGRFNLHGHCLLWIEGFDEIRELFFDQNPLIRKAAHDENCDLLINAFALIMNTVKISM